MTIKHAVILAAILVAHPAAGHPLRAEAKRSPNIVLILADDMGWNDLACYGNRFHETPNIDRLAKQGMRFTNAYAACPVCSPTRASIVTGRYPARIGVTDFIPGHWRPWEKLVVPKIHNELPPSEVTFAEMLKSAGYVSAAFGKWHLGGADNYPGHQGFDDFIVTGGRHFSPRFRTTPKVPIEDGTYLGDFLTDQALRFIDQNRERPFVLFLSHYAVHIPLEAKPALINKYKNKQPKPDGFVNNPIYAAMVEHVDESVGRVTEHLEKRNLADNTVVIFFSDNGGLYQRFDKQGPPVMTNKPLRDEKGSLYEGGIREPLIVRWPGKVAAGSVCDVPVTSVDFFPTMLNIAGLIDQVTPKLDGVSLIPLLTGNAKLGRDAIYWHYPHYHHTTPAGAIRRGDYKLIEYFDDGRVELYNLNEDISEMNDLAGAKPDLARSLRQQLAKWRNSVGAKMPTKNPDYDPTRAHEWKRRPRPGQRKNVKTKKKPKL